MAQEMARRMLRGTTRMALTGVTAGVGAWAATAGVRQVLKRRADEALQIAAQTPLGRVLPEPDMPDDGAEQEAATIAEAARRARDTVVGTVGQVVGGSPAADEGVEDEGATDGTAGPSGGEAAAPEPYPARGDSGSGLPTAADVGAPGVATEAAEHVTKQLQREHSIPAEPARDELPIPDFDNISLASIRARMRRLDVEQLVVLREWELAHAHRLPIVTMLDNRIAKLQSGQA